MPGAAKFDFRSVRPGVAPRSWLSPGLGANGVRASLHGVIDRSAMRFELWESPEAEAEAGLITAQQRERSVRFDAIGVGRRGRWLTGRDDLQRRSRP